MALTKHRVIQWSLISVSGVAAFGLFSAAVAIYRLPELGSELHSNAQEVMGKRIVLPGESGFWVLYPTRSVFPASAGGGGKITWQARKGMVPTLCEQEPNFDYCWGFKLSTIEGGNWKVDKNNYRMVGRLYFHYKPVANGTPGAVPFEGKMFVKDGASCAGDFTKAG